MVTTFLAMFVFFMKEMVFIGLFTVSVFVAPAVVTRPPAPRERRKVPTYFGSYLTYTDISAKFRYHIIIFIIITCKKNNNNNKTWVSYLS